MTTFLIFHISIQHSKKHCKIYFTITRMSPINIWPDTILAESLYWIGIVVTAGIFSCIWPYLMWPYSKAHQYNQLSLFPGKCMFFRYIYGWAKWSKVLTQIDGQFCWLHNESYAVYKLNLISKLLQCVAICTHSYISGYKLIFRQWL